MFFIKIIFNFVKTNFNIMAKRKITYDSKETTVIDRQTGEIAKVELQKRSKIYVDSEPFYMVFIDYMAPLYDLKNGTSKAVLS